MFKNKGIGFKIYFGFTALIAIILGMGIFSYVTLEDIKHEVHLADDVILPQTLTVLELEKEIINTQQLITDASATGDMEVLNEAKEERSKFEKSIVKLKNLEKDENVHKNIKELEEAFDEFYETGMRMSKAYLVSRDAGNKVMEEFDADSSALLTMTEKIKEKHLKELHEDFELMTANTAKGELFSLVAVAISLIVGITVGIFTVRSIVPPVTKLGDELKTIAGNVFSASNQLSGAAQELSSSSNEQASSIEETSSSLEEMAGMVENNVSNADEAYKLSNQVREISDEADSTMTSLDSSMQEILKSNTKIEELVKVIGNIGEKTKIMDEIVFQTKLLSFNASVEAERAGEHGRGFAVVAQEVGNLAQMSGKSAQEIAEIVKTSINEAEAITGENKKKVEEGNKYVGETSKKLKDIRQSAKTVSEGAKQVLDASKDQSKGIEQINSAMNQVDKATQENASISEETASSSEELSSQAESLQFAVDSLMNIVRGVAEQTINEKPTEVRPTQHKAKSNVVSIAQHKEVNTPMKQVVDGDTNQSDDAWEKL